MRVELAILGLLMKGSIYGYDIHKKLLELSGGYINIKFGSIYHALKKALKNGWVKKTGKEKKGGSPERYIYRITPEGKRYYIKNLSKYYEKILIHFDVDLVLMFLQSLEEEDKELFIEDRVETMNLKLKEIREKIEKEKEASEDISLLSYIENHLKAELAWVKTI